MCLSLSLISWKWEEDNRLYQSKAPNFISFLVRIWWDLGRWSQVVSQILRAGSKTLSRIWVSDILICSQEPEPLLLLVPCKKESYRAPFFPPNQNKKSRVQRWLPKLNLFSLASNKLPGPWHCCPVTWSPSKRSNGYLCPSEQNRKMLIVADTARPDIYLT